MDNGESSNKAPGVPTDARTALVAAAVVAGLKVSGDWWPELAPLTLKERAYVRARVRSARFPS